MQQVNDMVKKLSYIILSFVLLISTMGIAVSKHYCGSSFVSVSFFSEAKSCCETDGCCHNENHFFKVQDDYSTPQILDMPKLMVIDTVGNVVLSNIVPVTSKAGNRNFVFLDLPPPSKIQKSLALKQTYLL